MSMSVFGRSARVLLACALLALSFPLGASASPAASVAAPQKLTGARAGGMVREAPEGVSERSGDAATSAPATFVDGEVLVRFGRGISAAGISAAHASLGSTVKQTFTLVSGLQSVKLGRGLSVEEAVAAYEAMPGVLYAQPNYVKRIASVFPDDPLFPTQWGLHNDGTYMGNPDRDMDLPEAWEYTTGSSDVVIAVIDTGVDYNHPDLAANIWTNPGEIAGNGIDDDGNGYVDDIHGWDAANDDGDPMDDHGHGTHCSGIIGAESNNATGVAGVNWDVSIMGVKFLDSDGYGSTEDAIEAFEYIEAAGADLSSNSWSGWYTFDQAEYDAIAAIDKLFVFAAGNDAMDIDEPLDPLTDPDVYAYPAAYDLDNILSVGASEANEDGPAGFSNYGHVGVDVFAPGEQIMSTVPAKERLAIADDATINPIFSDDFTTLDNWVSTDYYDHPWELSTAEFRSAPSSVSYTNYLNDDYSYLDQAAYLDLSGADFPGVRFWWKYDVEDGWDSAIVGLYDASEGMFYNLYVETGTGDGFEEVVCDLSPWAGQTDVALWFGLMSDSSVNSANGYEGVYVDDVEVFDLDPGAGIDRIFEDDMSDLSGWDVSSYAYTPWQLLTDAYTSAPSAAGVPAYADNESAWMKLGAPFDLSSYSDADLVFSSWLDLENAWDYLYVYASHDGSTWDLLDSSTGTTGWLGRSVGLASYCGDSSVWVAFRMYSDFLFSGGSGYDGVRIDDVCVDAPTPWVVMLDYSEAYEAWDGTSMATPNVAGVAGLLLAQDGTRTWQDLKNRIMETVDVRDALAGRCVTSGRVNAASALTGEPSASDDAYVATRNTRLSVAAPGVLENDVEPDGEPMTAQKVSGPAHGTLTLNATGAFTYVPNDGYIGPDSFTYTARDALGATSEPATVDIDVQLASGAVRVAGDDRYLTAVEASAEAFDSADTVVIATGANWPDALGGSALAGAVGGPLLLTAPGDLPGVVADEIERLGATRAYILGGESAVSTAVETELNGLLGSANVDRLFGSDRYGTAKAIADKTISILGSAYDGGALMATGANFPDATGASPLAASLGWPILLRNPVSGSYYVPSATTHVLILGGTSAVSYEAEAGLKGLLGDANVDRAGGDNRYETAAKVAQAGVDAGMQWNGVGIATGENFPDALAGGAMLGAWNSVMLLTTPTALRPEAQAKLAANAAMIDTLYVIGGEMAVSQATMAAAKVAATVF